jgi:FMN phosphatase YigB (HAD superfamily)
MPATPSAPSLFPCPARLVAAEWARRSLPSHGAVVHALVAAGHSSAAAIAGVVAAAKSGAIPPVTGFMICDLDSTLVPCTEVYADAVERYVTRLHVTFPAILVDQLRSDFHAHDHAVAMTPNGPGFARHRFPTSMAQLFERLWSESGRVMDDAALAEQAALYAIGETVFAAASYAPYPGVIPTLNAYVRAGWLLALWTKGDADIQNRLKIDAHDLRPLFPVIQIVPRKGVESVLAAAAALCASDDLSRCFVVGDSRKDDIASAAGAGMSSVWVRGQADAPAAFGGRLDAGQEQLEPTYTVARFADLPTVLPVAGLVLA